MIITNQVINSISNMEELTQVELEKLEGIFNIKKFVFII
ncbi:MAG: hypothetical protein K0R05_2490 [Anaerocolumna sp.]|jgi:hypothetical protein|nr:hypothetical protein [Anaerocolumna sp.]